MVEVKVQVVNDINPDGTPGNPDLVATLPTYGSAGAAGADIYCMGAVKLIPHMPTLIHTGLKFEIPKGYELQVRPRSGIALSDGVTVMNAPGTIDEDYRGELGIILVWNGANTTLNKFELGEEDGVPTLLIPDKTRIAQIVLSKVEHADFTVVGVLGETERAEGGFGHTGIN